MKVCRPAARKAYVVGDLQETAVAPSREQVVLVTVPVVAQANVEYDACATGSEVNRTVGGPPVTADAIVHEYVALDDPAALETVTTNRCEPRASPAYDRGDVHADAKPPSSEHCTLVGEPDVVKVNVAAVDVVLVAGPDVMLTLGPVGDGGGCAPESSTVPKSCVQYQAPLALRTAPTPIAR